MPKRKPRPLTRPGEPTQKTPTGLEIPVPTREEVEAGATKEDIAITPLGVPMLAGPGAISTALILLSQARGWEQQAALFGCIAVVLLASYLIFHLAVHGARRLSPLALKLVTRLMGLLLAAVSVQFTINALRQMGVPLNL